MARRKFNLKYIENELKNIGKRIPKKVKVVLIGGANMMYRGLKAATKDVDLVIMDPNDLKLFSEALFDLGYFEVKHLSKEYTNLGASSVMRNEDGFQYDIFYKQVCNALIITPRIIKRAEKFGQFKNLTVSLMSPEDVFLFKGITERSADLEDMRILVEQGLDWEIILDECQKQEGERIWEAFLHLKLEELQDKYRIRTPITGKLRQISEYRLLRDMITSFLGDERTYKELSDYIQEKLHCSDSWIRKHISTMLKEGLIQRKRHGRTFIYYRENPIKKD
ncbi:MAG: nucleotidyltransferase [Thermoplasmata archaeon]|nr:MAG: nucleotidyltransferase [Thermoplasmata archaeon]